jgi:hypothetical protein
MPRRRQKLGDGNFQRIRDGQCRRQRRLADARFRLVDLAAGQLDALAQLGLRDVSPTGQLAETRAVPVDFGGALNRAAVKLGIGRYLYRLPRQCVDWDAQKRQFARVTMLPPHALPPVKPKPTAEPPRSGAPKPNATPRPTTPVQPVPADPF